MSEEFEDLNETEEVIEEPVVKEQPPIDSKYRMIILAAQRSKQLQRGATPRVDSDPRKMKSTRIAMKELDNGKVHFEMLSESQFSTKQ